MREILLSWDAPEFYQKERDSDWFWAVGVIATAIIITAILLNNILLALFFVIATIAIFLFAKRNPSQITVEITENGVKIGPNMYPFLSIKAFWIEEETPFPRLLLKTSSIINPLITVPIPPSKTEKAKEVLLNFKEEEEIIEPLSQKILEKMGF